MAEKEESTRRDRTKRAIAAKIEKCLFSGGACAAVYIVVERRGREGGGGSGWDPT